MASQAVRPSIGAVGVKLLYPDGTIQHAGIVLGIGGVAGHAHKGFKKTDTGYFSSLYRTSNCAAVTGACLMVRKELFMKVGGLDSNLAVAFNDVDFCIKLLQHGFNNILLPQVEMIHHESKSRGYEDTPEKRNRFQREIGIMQKRWGGLLQKDPYYNPNLTLIQEDFSIKR